MSGGRFLEGFLVGGVIGYLAGLFSAPRSGSELRREIAAGSDELYRSASESMSSFKGQAGKTIDDCKSKGQAMLQKASAGIEEQRDKLASQLEKLTGQGAEALVDDNKEPPAS